MAVSWAAATAANDRRQHDRRHRVRQEGEPDRHADEPRIEPARGRDAVWISQAAPKKNAWAMLGAKGQGV